MLNIILKDNRGLTLLELVVALLIISILFCGVFETFRLSFATSGSINNGMEYMHFAQGLMEEYRSMSYHTLNKEVQKSQLTPRRYQPPMVTKNGYQGQVIVTALPSDHGERLEILVRVYPIADNSKQYKLIYIKAKY
jgi:prepilin-type N-terminal cleavage/methylation domain-containing protein